MSTTLPDYNCDSLLDMEQIIWDVESDLSSRHVHLRSCLPNWFSLSCLSPMSSSFLIDALPCSAVPCIIVTQVKRVFANCSGIVPGQPVFFGGTPILRQLTAALMLKPLILMAVVEVMTNDNSSKLLLTIFWSMACFVARLMVFVHVSFFGKIDPINFMACAFFRPNDLQILSLSH